MAKKKNKTFAVLAKEIISKYKKRLGENFERDDPMAVEAMNRELQALMAQQEAVRAQTLEGDEVVKCRGGRIRKRAFGGGLPQRPLGGLLPYDNEELQQFYNGGGINNFNLYDWRGLPTDYSRMNLGPPQGRGIDPYPILPTMDAEISPMTGYPNVIGRVQRSLPDFVESELDPLTKSKLLNSKQPSELPQLQGTDPTVPQFLPDMDAAKLLELELQYGPQSAYPGPLFQDNISYDTTPIPSGMAPLTLDPNIYGPLHHQKRKQKKKLRKPKRGFLSDIPKEAWISAGANIVGAGTQTALALGNKPEDLEYDPVTLAPFEKISGEEGRRSIERAYAGSVDRSMSPGRYYNARMQSAASKAGKLAEHDETISNMNAQALNAYNQRKAAVELQNQRMGLAADQFNLGQEQQYLGSIGAGIGNIAGAVSQLGTDALSYRQQRETMPFLGQTNYEVTLEDGSLTKANIAGGGLSWVKNKDGKIEYFQFERRLKDKNEFNKLLDEFRDRSSFSQASPAQTT